ncbi:hypothetical protein [Alkalicoccobacillus gibsonii]|uniref:hypothetical protein n=1 Tax=Alkalicoccobacillus gibsonii TaxID=79881 RepID=UPI0019334F9D|nr:hypothetical protein [Alkalicoccobacillus gibsonii]MBM0067184.1 hypothetical protein [Alkalicoccobacillus gibsonii]
MTIHNKVTLDIYTTNADLQELRQGIIHFSPDIANEFRWTSGANTDDSTHYLSVRFFNHTNRGHVALEIILDNKQEVPESLHSHFYTLTELNQLDDFARKLKILINEEASEIEGLLATLLYFF